MISLTDPKSLEEDNPSFARTFAFKSCMDDCNLMDFGFEGPRFTWTNKRENGHLIFEPLDRALCTPDQCEHYPESTIYHLPRTRSDHAPILFHLDLDHHAKKKLFVSKLCGFPIQASLKLLNKLGKIPQQPFSKAHLHSKHQFLTGIGKSLVM